MRRGFGCGLLAIVVLGCDRGSKASPVATAAVVQIGPSATAGRFVPSSDPAIERALSTERQWIGQNRKVLFYLSHGSPHFDQWSGLHVDDDGSVWSFNYAGPSYLHPHCDYTTIPDSVASEACHFEDSKLVARVSAPILRELKSVMQRIQESPRAGGGRGGGSELTARIVLNGLGKPTREPIILAECMSGQIPSPEADFVIQLVRRLRQAIPYDVWLCGQRSPEDDTRTGGGVRAWWLR